MSAVMALMAYCWLHGTSEVPFPRSFRQSSDRDIATLPMTSWVCTVSGLLVDRSSWTRDHSRQVSMKNVRPSPGWFIVVARCLPSVEIILQEEGV